MRRRLSADSASDRVIAAHTVGLRPPPVCLVVRDLHCKGLARDRRFDRAPVKWVGRLFTEHPSLGLGLAADAVDNPPELRADPQGPGRRELALVMLASGESRAAQSLEGFE